MKALLMLGLRIAAGFFGAVCIVMLQFYGADYRQSLFKLLVTLPALFVGYLSDHYRTSLLRTALAGMLFGLSSVQISRMLLAAEQRMNVAQLAPSHAQDTVMILLGAICALAFVAGYCLISARPRRA
jgi:hypothetical protein